MKLIDLNPRSFRNVGKRLGLYIHMEDGHLQIRELTPQPLWARCLSANSCFCRAVVQNGILTRRQMVHAALRYRLGRSTDDAVIYWQIDQLGRVHDGKLMWYGPDCHRLKNRNATWAMHLMKKRFGLPQYAFHPTHVFFGSHLASNAETVCIVEAEKSAVILSELYPQYTWLAAGGLFELQPQKFWSLRSHKVILFPDTDPDLQAFTTWYDVAQQVMRSFYWPRGNPIHVSDFLERHATPEQKRRKIDLVDYILDNKINIQPSV